MHLWHDLSPGPDTPHIVNGIIEIGKGMRTKYEVDKPTGLLRLDRILHSATYYPVNYGIIPRTLGPDGDPVDILVLCGESILPGTLVAARVIGLMRMTDQGVQDDKVLAVLTRDPFFAPVQDVSGIPAPYLRELAHFFETYTDLEDKVVTVPAFEGAEAAYAFIQEGITRYAAKFIDR